VSWPRCHSCKRRHLFFPFDLMGHHCVTCCFRRSHRSFKTFSPKEDHVVVAISFSPSGDRFVVATGSAQPMVFDHDGNRLATFVKGDPYIMDMYHTHGHNALVTGAQWHPSNPNVGNPCHVSSRFLLRFCTRYWYFLGVFRLRRW
jgi:WD40 repeat protein